MEIENESEESPDTNRNTENSFGKNTAKVDILNVAETDTDLNDGDDFIGKNTVKVVVEVGGGLNSGWITRVSNMDIFENMEIEDEGGPHTDCPTEVSFRKSAENVESEDEGGQNTDYINTVSIGENAVKI